MCILNNLLNDFFINTRFIDLDISCSISLKQIVGYTNLTDSNDEDIVNQEYILESVKQFYKNLYGK